MNNDEKLAALVKRMTAVHERVDELNKEAAKLEKNLGNLSEEELMQKLSWLQAERDKIEKDQEDMANEIAKLIPDFDQ